jgi:hypothetical protein
MNSNELEFFPVIINGTAVEPIGLTGDELDALYTTGRLTLVTPSGEPVVLVLGELTNEGVTLTTTNRDAYMSLLINSLTDVFAKIALDICAVETLQPRGSDRLDFHEISVENLELALRAAYELGRKAKS